MGLLTTLLLLLLASPALAQESGLITIVTGDGETLGGARVELIIEDVVLRSTLTDPSGRAVFLDVATGTYTLRVQAVGYRSVTRGGVLLFASGPPLLLPIDLHALPIDLGGIEVQVDRIQIRRQNTEFSTTVDQSAIRLMPLPNDVSELVALVPGARPDHVWGGANFQANSYRMDGLPTNHPGLGGSAFQPRLNWIDEVEVQGLGAGAEHGGFQGGQIHVKTKSGTNDFHAMLRNSGEHHLLSGTNLVATEIGAEVDTRYDLDGEVSGAIVRDQLFYYLAGTYVEQESRFLNHLANVDSRYSPLVEERQERNLFGKLTWSHGSSRTDLTGGYLETSAENYGMTGYEGADATLHYSSPVTFASLNHRRVVGDWGVLEGRVNHLRQNEQLQPSGGPDQPGIRLFSLIPPYTGFGNAPFRLHSNPVSSSAALAGTFRLNAGAHEHMIKVGGEYTAASFRDRRLRNGGMTWLPIRSALFDPEDPRTWSGDVEGYTRTEWGGEVDLDADVVNEALFVQTAISVGDRVVLSPGLRWGRWRGWLTPSDADRFLAVEDAGFDPRVGAMVELVPDGSMVLKAHWGRYHQDMITQMFDRAGGASVFTNREIWHYTGPSPGSPDLRFTLGQRDSLAALGMFTHHSTIQLNETGPVVDYRQPYMDQWLLAFEKQFGSSVKVEALYTRRSNRNLVALVDRNWEGNYTRFNRVTVHMAGPSGPPLPYGGLYVSLPELYVPNYAVLAHLRHCADNPDVCGPPPGMTFADTLNLTWNPDLVLTNPSGARREFSQFQFVVDISRPSWGASASVSFTDLEGNLDNVSGYDDPSKFGPGPYVRINEGVNAFGKLPNAAARELKVSIWGALPWQLRGGLFWTYRSGDRYSARFKISADQTYYGYRTHAHAARVECWMLADPDFCTEGQWGVALPQEFLAPLEGHSVFIGPRGGLQLERRSNLDVRLERMFSVSEATIGLTLQVLNVFGGDAVTRIQQMVNHGENFNYFNKDISDPSLWAFPPNLHFNAPLERMPPRRIQLGAKVYL